MPAPKAQVCLQKTKMKRQFFLTSFFLAFVALPSVAPAQQVVIRTGTVFDGKGQTLRNKDLVIEDDHIAAIRDRSGRADYDLSAFTVTPGWIDTHVHPSWHFNKESRLEQGGRRSKETPEQTALYTEADVYKTLLGGFTTIQSVGAEVDGPVRDLIAQGLLPGPARRTRSANTFAR